MMNMYMMNMYRMIRYVDRLHIQTCKPSALYDAKKSVNS